jgi:hypothetical protein
VHSQRAQVGDTNVRAGGKLHEAAPVVSNGQLDMSMFMLFSGGAVWRPGQLEEEISVGEASAAAASRLLPCAVSDCVCQRGRGGVCWQRGVWTVVHHSDAWSVVSACVTSGADSVWSRLLRDLGVLRCLPQQQSQL